MFPWGLKSLTDLQVRPSLDVTMKWNGSSTLMVRLLFICYVLFCLRLSKDFVAVDGSEHA